MNTTLLRATKTLLKHQDLQTLPLLHLPLHAIGYSYFDTKAALFLLRRAVAEAPFVLPLQAIATWYVYKKEKEQSIAILQELYPKILAWHRTLYEKHDMEEEGLPYNPSESGQLQDPLFLALLVWSNEYLIKIGHTLQENVLEIIQWNELTIFSMNEKLWDEQCVSYRAFDTKRKTYAMPKGWQCFAPLVAEVPTQEQAEQMLIALKATYKQRTTIDVFDYWLLCKGFLRYDFTAMAAQMRQELGTFFSEHGFYNCFDAQSGMPLQTADAPSPLAAALAIDLLKRV